MPTRIVFGNLEGAVRRGQGGKEKEWTNCVQSDIRAFGIAGDRKTTALEAEVWVEAVAEPLDIARRRESRRDWDFKVVIVHGSVEPAN